MIYIYGEKYSTYTGWGGLRQLGSSNSLVAARRFARDYSRKLAITGNIDYHFEYHDEGGKCVEVDWASDLLKGR